MIDQGYAGIMVYLEGDIPAEVLDARIESARQRAAAWRKGVAMLIQQGGPNLPEPAGQAGGSGERGKGP